MTRPTELNDNAAEADRETQPWLTARELAASAISGPASATLS